MLVAFHARVQPGQPLFQLLIELADEDLGVAGEVQDCGLRFAFAGKSNRQVLIGVAVAVRYGHPQFFRPEALPDC